MDSSDYDCPLGLNLVSMRTARLLSELQPSSLDPRVFIGVLLGSSTSRTGEEYGAISSEINQRGLLWLQSIIASLSCVIGDSQSERFTGDSGLGF